MADDDDGWLDFVVVAVSFVDVVVVDLVLLLLLCCLEEVDEEDVGNSLETS